jgi:hypothetical protein
MLEPGTAGGRTELVDTLFLIGFGWTVRLPGILGF